MRNQGRGILGASVVTPVVVLMIAAAAGGQTPERVSLDGVWTSVERSAVVSDAVEPWVRPENYAAFTVDALALDAVLAQAPLEATVAARFAQAEILLPMPDGTFARFRFVESPVMAPELAARYPEIRTFLGQGIDDPHAVVRFDTTPTGFHAQILSPHGAVYIDPLNRNDSIAHASYYKRDRLPRERPTCTLFPNPDGVVAARGGGDFLRTAETLRTYRLANAATGEYTAFHGGTVALGQAAIVTAINRVTGIYEVEVGVRMELVANNDLVVYTNGGTDPYTNNDGGAMLSQNISNLNSVIGSANYDIGHVFSTGGGGVAYLGVICTSWKGGGVTGRFNPVGDAFYVDYVAHEMGHQFGGSHTFNGVTSSCSGGNRNDATAYEPGSGSTIQAYAGICGADNLQAHSDPYFHHESFRQIRNHITAGSGSGCSVNTATGNSDPTVNAGANHTIPMSTPFILTPASASDPDSDPLTYCWEQRDLGSAQALTEPDNGSSPLWRSWDPTTDSFRIFPRLFNLLLNNTPLGEQLPTTSRTMNFRCTVRDNRAGGGGVGFDDMVVTVDAGSGPFLVTSPNTAGVVWAGSETVTWDVAGTDGAPVNAATVNILLSTDGGNTFPVVLLANTPNDGSEAIIVPNTPTTTARVKVEAVGNIFFDLSNANFTIEENPALAILVPGGPPSSVTPLVPTPFDVQIVSLAETVVPGSPTLHYRYDGGVYQTAALVSLGGDLYEATLPPALCGDVPEFYLSAQGDGGTTITDPGDAPTSVYSAAVGTAVLLMADDFETDQGWTATNLGASSGDWQRGVPVNDPGWDFDPISDSDGSGQCYLTQNETGNTDIDGGAVQLDSPVIDMSGGNVTIDYDYYLYLNNTDGIDKILVEISNNGGASGWTEVARHDTNGGTSWRSHTITQSALDVAGVILTANMVVRFTANDEGDASINESGLDAFVVNRFACVLAGDGDFDVDGDVDLLDFARMQDCWGQVGVTVPCLPGDLTGDDEINADDFTIFNLVIDGPMP